MWGLGRFHAIPFEVAPISDSAQSGDDISHPLMHGGRRDLPPSQFASSFGTEALLPSLLPTQVGGRNGVLGCFAPFSHSG